MAASRAGKYQMTFRRLQQLRGVTEWLGGKFKFSLSRLSSICISRRIMMHDCTRALKGKLLHEPAV